MLWADKKVIVVRNAWRRQRHSRDNRVTAIRQAASPGLPVTTTRDPRFSCSPSRRSIAAASPFAAKAAPTGGRGAWQNDSIGVVLWERHLAAISSHFRHLTSQYFFFANTNFQELSASG